MDMSERYACGARSMWWLRPRPSCLLPLPLLTTFFLFFFFSFFILPSACSHARQSPLLYALGTFVTAPSDVIVAHGSTARFDCVYLASFPISISWQKNGTIVANVRYSVQVNGSLVISSAQAADAATYTCVVLNVLTGVTAQSSAILQLACEWSTVQNHSNCVTFFLSLLVLYQAFFLFISRSFSLYLKTHVPFLFLFFFFFISHQQSLPGTTDVSDSDGRRHVRPLLCPGR